MKTQTPILTAAMVKDILDGVALGSLTRDEMEHALVTAFSFEVSEKDTDADLVGYLELCLGG